MKRLLDFEAALALTLSHIQPGRSEYLPLERLSGRILATDLFSRVDSPSVNASLKDGYAVCSEEIAGAGPEAPVVLELAGEATAGRLSGARLAPGRAIRITTGAGVPAGADAVLSEEFTRQEGGKIICYNTAEPGRNILEKGTDIRQEEIVARRQEKISPALVGLLATAGLDGAEVFRVPTIGVLATGDEVVAPGHPLPEGKLYASNITAICAWLGQYGIPTRVAFARDKKNDTMAVIQEELPHVDGFVSSGGIWGSEKDLMLDVLESLKWRGLYHRVKIGPGKAVAFGFLEEKPFFCLPGGPPSNEMAFLQIALPGLLRMAGETRRPFPVIRARLLAEVTGNREWTQFVHAGVSREAAGFAVMPLKQKSRLQAMAGKNSLITIPRECPGYPAGTVIKVQLLNDRVLYPADMSGPGEQDESGPAAAGKGEEING